MRHILLVVHVTRVEGMELIYRMRSSTCSVYGKVSLELRQVPTAKFEKESNFL